METFSNASWLSEIVLSGFPSLQHLHVLLFIMLLLIYLLIIAGNVLILLVVQKLSRLHPPMYFFIGTLSVLEICYTAITMPKMLADLLNEEKKISFTGCLLQAYFLHAVGAAGLYLLIIMGYDRYLAICKPLQYPSIMTARLYVNLVVVGLTVGLLSPVIETILIALLPYCGPNRIQNVFCDFPTLISLACTDTKLYIWIEFVVSCLIILLSFAFVLLTYIKIIYTILKIKSKVGRQKMFSTCGAHLIIVCVSFGSIAFMYIRVTESHTVDYDRAAGLTYAIFVPIANPIIYGFRNKEIKSCLNKLIMSKFSHTALKISEIQ